MPALLACHCNDRSSAPVGMRGGRLAQLVERLVYTEDVGSSSLSPPTMSCLTLNSRRSSAPTGRAKARAAVAALCRFVGCPLTAHHTLCVASCLRVAARQPNPLVPVRGFSSHLYHTQSVWVFLAHDSLAALDVSAGAGESPGRSRGLVQVRGGSSHLHHHRVTRHLTFAQTAPGSRLAPMRARCGP